MRENRKTCTANKHQNSNEKRNFFERALFVKMKIANEKPPKTMETWEHVKVVCRWENWCVSVCMCDDVVRVPSCYNIMPWNSAFPSYDIPKTSGSYVILFLCKLREKNNTLCVLVSSSPRSHYVHQISFSIVVGRRWIFGGAENFRLHFFAYNILAVKIFVYTIYPVYAKFRKRHFHVDFFFCSLTFIACMISRIIFMHTKYFVWAPSTHILTRARQHRIHLLHSVWASSWYGKFNFT